LQPIDEGAEVALRTVDKEAGLMRQVLFVLKDDDIYDAWVQKAEELQFISLDDSSAVAASTTKRSNDNKKNTKQEPSPNEKSKVKEQRSEMRVIDKTTSDDDKLPKDSSIDPHDEESGESGEDDNASNKDKKNKKKKRYVIKTTECMLFPVSFVKFMNEKESNSIKYLNI
jgi:hypothetical protein